MLSFLGMLFGVFLSGLANFAARHLPVSRGVGLLLSCIILVLVLGGGIWGLGAQIAKQTEGLAKKLPEAAEKLQSQVAELPLGRYIVRQQGSVQNAAQQQVKQIPEQAPRIARWVFDLVGGVLLILFMGLFFAAKPEIYRAGIIRLLPHHKRKRGEEVFDALELALRRWLLGLAASMAAAGILTAIGLWLLKIPMALALGVVAAFGEIIPNFGSIAATIPAVMIALLDAPEKVIWVIALYIVIQTLQGYVITPLAYKQAVRIPPALEIGAVVLFGVLLGPLGLLVATPLLAVILILVKLLYVHDELGDPVKEDPANNSDPNTAQGTDTP